MDIPAKAERCRSISCQEGDCSLDVSGLGRQIDIVELNCIRHAYRLEGRICDFGIVWRNKNIIAAVELKGGARGTSLRKLVGQIQKGLDALDGVLEGQPVQDFYPLLLYRSRNTPVAALSGTKVVFRGKERAIIPEPCGTLLSAVVKKFPR